MKRLILPIFLLSLNIYAQDNLNLYEKALSLEKEEKYKEAMQLYKQIAKENLNSSDKYLIDIKKNTQENQVESFTNMKKNFYQKQVDKLEDSETNESLKQMIVGDFNLYPYEKNYLMPVTYDLQKSDDGRNQFETQFQISVKKPISYDFFGLNETISGAYTQKSFWQTSKHSSPFRETNYKPEIFVMFPYENSERLKAIKLSLLHESNGKNNEESRSWNRIYAQGYFQLSNLFISPKVWYRIPESDDEDDNPDIEKYYGNGDLTFLYAYKRHTFELDIRNNLRFNADNKGAVEFNWAFPLPQFLSTKNSYGMLNIFSGYGNNLIDYDKEVNKIGLGIALSR